MLAAARGGVCAASPSSGQPPIDALHPDADPRELPGGGGRRRHPRGGRRVGVGWSLDNNGAILSIVVGRYTSTGGAPSWLRDERRQALGSRRALPAASLLGGLLLCLDGCTVTKPPSPVHDVARTPPPTWKHYPACTSAPTLAKLVQALSAIANGREAFDGGNYGRAIEHWEDAYGVDCTADDLLPILATAYELDGNIPQAIVALETYTGRQPSARVAPQLERKVARLRKRAGRTAPPRPKSTPRRVGSLAPGSAAAKPRKSVDQKGFEERYARFREEPRNEEWATATEQWIHQSLPQAIATVRQLGPSGPSYDANIGAPECQSTTCVLEVRGDRGEVASVFEVLRALARDAPRPGPNHRHDFDVDGGYLPDGGFGYRAYLEFATTDCGNLRVEPGEECDGLARQTCAEATDGRLTSGHVLCRECKINVSRCYP